MKIAVFLRAPGLFLPEHDDALLERVRALPARPELIDCRSEDEFLAALGVADMAAVWHFRPEWYARAGKALRLVATPAAGRELVRGTPPPGVEVYFSRFHGAIMAETTICMMLAFVRQVYGCVRDGMPGWPRGETIARIRTLRGAHAVILGFGSIGKTIGKMLQPFGARLTGVNRSDFARPDYFTAADKVVPVSMLDAVLPTADHLIVVLPSDTGTDRILDKRRLGLLPRGAYLYNIGRGNAVDEAALAEALHDGRLAGAGLDVFAREPLADDSPLRSCPNAILLPHISAMSPDYLDLFFAEALEKATAMGMR